MRKKHIAREKKNSIKTKSNQKKNKKMRKMYQKSKFKLNEIHIVISNNISNYIFIH